MTTWCSPTRYCSSSTRYVYNLVACGLSAIQSETLQKSKGVELANIHVIKLSLINQPLQCVVFFSLKLQVCSNTNIRATILFPYSDILIWPTCETPSSWSDAGAGAFAQSRNVGSQSEMWTLKFWSWYHHNSGRTQCLISHGKSVSTSHQMVQLSSFLHPLPTKIQSNGRHPHLQPTIETLPWAQRTQEFSAFANFT